MKKLLFTFFLACSMLMVGCGGLTQDKFTAIGKPYEVLVVTPKVIWEGVVGDSIRDEMEKEVRWINQPEPLFTLSNVPQEAMNRTLSQHRNIFIVDINPKVDTVTFSTKTDMGSRGQIIVKVTAADQYQAANYIGEHIADIAAFLSATEQNRYFEQAKTHHSDAVQKALKDQFGVSMYIPKGYTVANSLEDYLWIKYEMRLASEGIVFYSFDRPQNGQKLNLVSERNRAMRHIPGPLEGTFMSTDTTFYPESIPVEINGVGWIETRGFWKVEGDFMGGPFINFVTLDPVTGRYFGIDMYLYAPDMKNPKRNFLRRLEALMLGVKFPQK